MLGLFFPPLMVKVGIRGGEADPRSVPRGNYPEYVFLQIKLIKLELKVDDL